MNHPRIVLGMAAWFLGVGVVVLHHGVLCASFALAQSHLHISDMGRVYGGIHWVEWLYLMAMAVLGLILVMAGLLGSGASRRPADKP